MTKKLAAIFVTIVFSMSIMAKSFACGGGDTGEGDVFSNDVITIDVIKSLRENNPVTSPTLSLVLADKVLIVVAIIMIALIYESTMKQLYKDYKSVTEYIDKFISDQKELFNDAMERIGYDKGKEIFN